MSARADQKAATRDRLLRQARRHCGRQGLAAARTADIARAAGLSHGALFVHFPTREDLLREVVRSYGRDLTDRLVGLARAGPRAALEAHVGAVARDEELYRHILLDGPSLGAAFHRAWTGLQSAVSHHLEEAFAHETDLRPAPWHLHFNTWIGLLHHYVMNKPLFAPRGGVLARHGQALIDHYLWLVKKETSK